MLAVALGVALIGAPEPVQAEPAVNDIRVGPHATGTRVVIELSQPVSFRHVTLVDPPRLAIDLPELDWRVTDGIGADAHGLIKGYRFGQFRPGVSRLVLDLAAPFEISNVFELPPNSQHGHRIVTDLAPLNGFAPDLPLAASDARRARVASLGGINGAAGVLDSPAGTQPAALSGPLRQTPPPKKPRRPDQIPTIVIDPGHGGIDPGAIGAGGVYEKDVVLAMAKELQRQLEATGRYRVVMTRTSDVLVRLRERLQIAREGGGDLLLSLHADSLSSAPQVRGASVYTLSEEASSREAAELARKENRTEILGGVDLSGQAEIVTQILIDLAQRDANNKSIRFAETLVKSLGATTKMARGQRLQAGFVVLKSPDMPSVLVELGYLSNATDEKQLTERAHQAKLSGAIVQAIDRYFAAGSS